MTTPKPDRLPPFPIDKILGRRDRLMAALHLRIGKVPEGDDFRAFCEELAFALQTGPSDPAVSETVRALPAKPLSAADLRIFCWRIAARLTELQKGRPVRPWSSQDGPEWMAFEILTGQFHRTKLGKPGYRYLCRILAGSACPDVTELWWSWKQIHRVSKLLGFAKRGRKKRPYQHPMQLVRLKFAAQVMPALSADQPRFDLTTLRVPAAMLKANQLVLSQRIRREPPCPFALTHPCHRCPIGYAVGPKTCPAAVHPVTWQWRPCGGCGEEGWHDPAQAGNRCVNCAAASHPKQGA